MLDIPEIQLVSIVILGFILGALFLPFFIRRPIFFTLVAGLLFFTVRYLVTIERLDIPRDGAPAGNGILSALVMWVIYVAMMVLGRVVMERRWGPIDK